MNNRGLVRAILLVACAIALLQAPPARAQAGITLASTPAFEGNYTPGTWLPITATITNAGSALSATLVATLPGAKVRHVQQVELPGGAQKRLVIYVAMEQTSREVRVSVEQPGVVLAEQTLAVRPRTNERLLAIVARTDPGLALPRREDLARMPFTSVRVAPTELPDHAAGLGSLGLLLINDIPPDSLSAGQINALLAWVYAGGHLFLGGGAAAKSADAWLPADLHAASIGDATQLNAAPLADLAGASGPGPLPAVKLAALPGGISAGTIQEPAWVTRPFGNGQITQFAFDPGTPAMRSWTAAATFWNAILQPAILVSTPFGDQTSVDYIQEQILAGTLTALPTIKQPPVDLLFLILAIYTFLIGPILALGLRRIDRQAWSWLIVPVAAVGFGLLFMAFALTMRANDQLITQMSLIEDIGTGQARERTFVGALASQPQTFAASLSGGVLARPIRETSGLYGSIGGVGGDLAQESEILALKIDAWQFQGVVMEQQVSLPSLTATVTIDSQGERIDVKNTTGRQLKDVVAIYGERVLRLGNMEPDEQLTGRWTPGPDSSGASISALVFADAVAEANRPGQVPDRRIQIQQSLISAAVNRGSGSSDIGPLVLAWVERNPPVTERNPPTKDRDPLFVDTTAPNATAQNLTMLVSHAKIKASGPIMLNTGWLRADPALSQRSACRGGTGVGVAASPAPVEITLRLPDDLTPLRASTVNVALDSSNPWPNAGISTEVYDWAQRAWVAQSFDGPGELKLTSAAPYLREGRLRLRLSGPIERAGCISVSAKLQGDMP
ncbi:MAG: hypothetical protein WCJ55_06380 [Chloroflexales bacterium]